MHSHEAYWRGIDPVEYIHNIHLYQLKYKLYTYLLLQVQFNVQYIRIKHLICIIFLYTRFQMSVIYHHTEQPIYISLLTGNEWKFPHMCSYFENAMAIYVYVCFFVETQAKMLSPSCN